MFRERVFEGVGFDLRGGARHVFGGRGRYLVDGGVEPRPSFMCSGNLGAAWQRQVLQLLW